MIEQRSNYSNYTVKEMTDLFETIVENLDPKEEKKKSCSLTSKKNKDNKNLKKRKREDSDSSVVESSEKSSLEHRPNKKNWILHGKYSHFTNNCKDLHDVSTGTNRRIRRQKEYQRIERSDWKEISEICEKQEKM